MRRLLRNTGQSALPAIGVSVPVVVMFVTVLSIPLAAGQTLGLTPSETAAWIWALYGLPGLMSLGLTLFYRQPLLLTGNIFAIIFLASLGDQSSYPELVGASILAGAIVVILGGLGLTGKLAAWIPAPIMLGLVAGTVLPYVVTIFTALAGEPIVIGSAVTAYFLGRRFLGARLPPILPALVAGLVAAAITGRLGAMPGIESLPKVVVTAPRFSFQAIITATPVLVVLMTLQANVPALIFIRGQGYRPPERALNVVTGAGSLLGSLLGPTAISIPVLLTPLTAGPDAGPKDSRHWAVYITGAVAVLIALLAGVAAELPQVVPLPLLQTLAGLALVGTLVNSLEQISQGPLRLGPLFTLVIALSPLSFFGLGRFFWALFFGLCVTLLLEGEALQAWRDKVTGPN